MKKVNERLSDLFITHFKLNLPHGIIISKIQRTSSELQSDLKRLKMVGIGDENFNPDEVEYQAEMSKALNIKKLRTHHSPISSYKSRRPSKFSGSDFFLTKNPSTSVKRKRFKSNDNIPKNTFSGNSHNFLIKKPKPTQYKGLFLTLSEEKTEKFPSKINSHRIMQYKSYKHNSQLSKANSYINLYTKTIKSNFFSPERTIESYQNFKRKHPMIQVNDLKKKFPKSKYILICRDFDNKLKENKVISDYMMKTYYSRNTHFSPKIEKKKNTLTEMENIEKKKRKLAHVINKRTGILSVVDKANADLINFGDSYGRFDNVGFYNRHKEILMKYQNVRTNAHLDIESPRIEDDEDRREKLHNYELEINKKFETVQREHNKLKNLIENFK